MNRISRRVALVPLVFLLTGCVSLNVGVTIHSDDNINVTMDVGLQQAVAQAAGIDDMCNTIQQDAASTPWPANTTFNSHVDNGYLMCSISGTETLADLNTEGFTLTHSDGVYAFAMASSGLSIPDTSGMGDLSTLLTKLSVSVTFPGQVLTHNGSSTVHGTTVTWTSVNDLLGVDGLSASGKDKASSPILLILGILAGLAVIALVVVLLLAARRRKAAAYAQAAAWQGQYQYGQPVPYMAPPPQAQWAQPMATPPTTATPPVVPPVVPPAAPPPNPFSRPV